MKRKLRALRDFRYGTRRLQAGDEFEATRAHAFALTRTRPARAEYLDGNRERVVLPPMPDTLKDRAMAGKPLDGGNPSEDLAMLRADYQTKFGKRPFYGWSADELRSRIAASE